MKTSLLCACLLVLAPLGLAAATASDARIEHSVVHLFVTAKYPDIVKPWGKSSPKDITGSGIVIEGKRILTNAHVVLYAGEIQVQGDQSGDKYSASVEYIDPNMDLALLKLDDNTFFEGRQPIERSGALPQLKDPVMAYGYPTGGSNLSITKGIVSRVEYAGYSASTSGLRIQIDAAINAGNSGGPAIAGDKMVGLAYSRLGGAQNIGYIIPCEEIELFLKDAADGKIDGKPSLYDSFQTNENPALQAFLKEPAGSKGVVVAHVDSADPAYPLHRWDLVTKIGGVAIDNEGMVRLPNGQPIRFLYEVQRVASNGKVELSILRDGKPVTVQVPLATQRNTVIPERRGDYPDYFICGPIVFSSVDSLTATVLDSARNAGGRMPLLLALTGNPMITRLSDQREFPDEELVFICSPFFPSKLTKGYSNPFSKVVSKVNGTKIRNLRHLVEVLRDLKDPYIVIEFDGRTEDTIVLPRKDTIAATEDILSDNGIRSQGSADLLEIWKGKKL